MGKVLSVRPPTSGHTPSFCAVPGLKQESWFSAAKQLLSSHVGSVPPRRQFVSESRKKLPVQEDNASIKTIR